MKIVENHLFFSQNQCSGIKEVDLLSIQGFNLTIETAQLLAFTEGDHSYFIIQLGDMSAKATSL